MTESHNQLNANRAERVRGHQTIDGVRATSTSRPITRRAAVAVPVRTIAQPVSPKTATTLMPSDNTLPRKPIPIPKRGLWQRLQTPFILFLGIIGGFLAQTTLFGVVAIVVYGILTLVLRIPSRTSFALAALSMAAVSFLLLFRPDPALAGTFTTYAFLFLVIGVIAISFEARPKARRKKRRTGR
ncbi:MAG: hypothetical protein AAB834_05615 [Patescibacteria group bacterium]